jgi:hypothetical protein
VKLFRRFSRYQNLRSKPRIYRKVFWEGVIDVGNSVVFAGYTILVFEGCCAYVCRIVTLL